MNTVTRSRTIDAPPSDVADAMGDLEPFMAAAGFDEVDVEGDRIRLAKLLGFARIELDLVRIERPDATLAYEQREGIFEEMVTTYHLEAVDDSDDNADSSATTVIARTEFALDVALVGDLLDATVIRRQRRRELEAQFDWLAAALTDDGSGE